MTLRELRVVTGISRAELERRAGLPPRRLEKYEAGLVSQNRMDISVAYKVAKVLKIKMEDLVMHDED